MHLHQDRIQRHGLLADVQTMLNVRSPHKARFFKEPAVAFESRIERELDCQSSVNGEKEHTIS